MSQVVQERVEVAKQDVWDLDVMYSGWVEWNKLFLENVGADKGVRWPELSRETVDLSNSSELRRLLDAFMRIDGALSHLYTYAHLRHDEDVVEVVAKEAYSSIVGVLHAFQAEVSWIEPSLLQLPKEVLDRLLSEKELQEYSVYLKKIIRLKPYTLSSQEEKLLAIAGKALETSQRAFSSLNNADLKFPSCLDQKGNLHELTHGMYQLYLKGSDRTLRKEAFTNLHETFAGYENTFCDLIQGLVERHVFYKKARGYASSLQAALYPHEIDESIYSSLISSVRGKLSFLHEYMRLRKDLLGYEKMHVYDLSVSLIDDVEISMSYDEAVKHIVDSVSLLGVEYQEVLRKGLMEDSWVDRYENKRKRSGAYSSGCYTSRPYILMNYHGTFQDAKTLAHEAGHSMHSYLSNQHQKYQDHKYPIFLAEVASTFHEELFYHHFFERAESVEEKIYLINQRIEGIRTTLFRQVLFAEFELKLHEWVESERPLTPLLLKENYMKLVQEYFGDAVEVDDVLASEWSRIPHFYYNFYVYQYATGLSAAHALAKRVIGKEALAKERFLEFLSSGSSKSPIETLEKAGVNMRTSESVDSLMDYFYTLVCDLRDLMNQKKIKDENLLL